MAVYGTLQVRPGGRGQRPESAEVSEASCHSDASCHTVASDRSSAKSSGASSPCFADWPAVSRC